MFSKSFLRLFKVFIDDVSQVLFSPDGRYIFSASGEGSIKIFDFESKQEIYHFEDVHEGTFSFFCFSFSSPKVV